MTHKALSWLLPFALVACGDDSAPGDGESSTGGSASTTGSETTPSTTQTSLSTTQSQTESTSDSSSESGLGSVSTGDPSSDTSTGEPSTGNTGSSSDATGTGTGEPDTSSSSGTLVCEIQEVVDAAAVGKMEPVDCGFVQLADPLDEWEAAHDCVLENYGSEAAFTVVAELQGIDSEIFIGYAGMVGETYVASQFFSDSYMGVTIYGTTPCNIGLVEDCTVAVGELCLQCIDAAKPELVCQA